VPLKTSKAHLPSVPDAFAIVWDYDGTLVDTRRKNLSVTRSIIQDLTGQDPDRFEPLSSLASYEAALLSTANWRDLYQQWFDLSDLDTDRAGHLWTNYQLQDTTETPVIDGIADVLLQLRNMPHGVLSQNGRAVISAVLQANHLLDCFQVVIGFEAVDFKCQKPAPDGLLLCLEKLTRLKPGKVFYIGDHETDALCAQRGQETLVQQNLNIEIVSIGAFYGSESRSSRADQFDHVAYQPTDIVAIVDSYFTPLPK
jgi:HAD superfamily hydrolase (TIGR01549 family)